ncbi:MAG: hypothetical protein GX484_09790 [Chloroflexi bacterium]|nr:hypothetical protein [Chloroflexota bacterium]
MFDKLREDVEEGIARRFFRELPRHRQIVEAQKRQEELLDQFAQLGYRVERRASRGRAGQVQAPQTLRKDLWSNVGRNDPCPCGSGKKFKDCHYRQIQKQRQTVDPGEVTRTVGRRRRR